MEKGSGICRDDEQMELPPGFQFHPTDEELIAHYLFHKVLDSSFCARAIGDVYLNKVEPWDLPCVGMSSIIQFQLISHQEERDAILAKIEVSQAHLESFRGMRLYYGL